MPCSIAQRSAELNALVRLDSVANVTPVASHRPTTRCIAAMSNEHRRRLAIGSAHMARTWQS